MEQTFKIDSFEVILILVVSQSVTTEFVSLYCGMDNQNKTDTGCTDVGYSHVETTVL